MSLARNITLHLPKRLEIGAGADFQTLGQMQGDVAG